MPVVSSLPTVKAYIITKLAALVPTTLAGVGVSYGHPGNALERQHIWIGGTSAFDQTWGPFGRLSKNETYTLKGFVFVQDPGDTQQAASERAMALFGIVELTFRTAAEVTLSGLAAVIDVRVHPTALFEGIAGEGRQALVEFDLEVNARI